MVVLEDPDGPVHEFLWDGRDEKGNDLAGGIYFVTAVEGREPAAVQKLLLLR
jgi:flagellar hook assembly protein FlgD